ncbi:MAG: outer membrane beta-barrel protein [Candidatus Krumholzibacteria bacterium]|nr:outer membrane beta-barrel protein [Candidatus Krumholzibacteria bacterium]
MRKICMLMVSILILALPAASFGVEKGDMEFGIGAGAGIPIGDFGDFAKTGYLFGVNFGYYVTPVFTLGLKADYHHFGASEDYMDILELLLVEGLEADFSIFQGTAYARYILVPGKFAPYIKGGAGLYNVKETWSGGDESGDSSDSYFGISGGLGAQFQGEGMTGGFVEMLFHNAFADDENVQYIQLRGGITLFLGAAK